MGSFRGLRGLFARGPNRTFAKGRDAAEQLPKSGRSCIAQRFQDLEVGCAGHNRHSICSHKQAFRKYSAALNFEANVLRLQITNNAVDQLEPEMALPARTQGSSPTNLKLAELH
ncbi:hypothetical protein SAMN04488002_0198 [Litoreibacter janthinus]|uniref:Uncharacterized protein n=1 Tax=Litoreibacter janthinus TaxID=670154 RepID=A0A1I6FS81_9RHOB|nr:hypothetical protein SAMN04488002_0198 [Litoreibacter janthinus]